MSNIYFEFNEFNFNKAKAVIYAFVSNIIIFRYISDEVEAQWPSD